MIDFFQANPAPKNNGKLAEKSLKSPFLSDDDFWDKGPMLDTSGWNSNFSEVSY